MLQANPRYLSVNWKASGGGAFAVIPLEERGRLPELMPLFRGHTGPVLDTDWSPFNDSIVASGSDDGKVFIWSAPVRRTVLPEKSNMAGWMGLRCRGANGRLRHWRIGAA